MGTVTGGQIIQGTFQIDFTKYTTLSNKVVANDLVYESYQ
jgi:hypothetical protein